MNCLNCNHKLSENDKFCPNCGQKVDGNNLKLSVLIKEFFENYISFDTRFGRSLKPFFFKPGFLTLEFNKGARKNYANPLRLYILTSILFFTTFTYYFVKSNESRGEIIQFSDKKEALNDFRDIDEKTKALLHEGLSAEVIERLNGLSDTNFVESFNQLSSLSQKRVGEVLPDSIQNELQLPGDSALQDASSNLQFNAGTKGVYFSFTDFDLQVIEKYKYDKNYTDEQLLDSLKMGEMTELSTQFATQVIHVYRSDSSQVMKFMFGNLSLIMFIILPVSALLLMLFFYKSRMKYAEHFIHTIHLHTFSFVILSILYTYLYFDPFEGVPSIIIRAIVFIILLIYFVKSIRKVYRRSRFETLVKSFFLGFIYCIIASIAFLSEVFVSFLLY